jgi:16S rRNA U516 pseudouridylate synthase RsuA-like enzyme
MFEAVGSRVTGLRRVREGPLVLGELAEGGVRRLGRSEVEALRGEPDG